jgi:hypothetical protein
MRAQLNVRRNYQVKVGNTYEHIRFELGVSGIPGRFLFNPEFMQKMWLLQALRLDGAYAAYIQNSPTLGNANLSNDVEVAKFAKEIEEMKKTTYQDLQKAMASMKEEGEEGLDFKGIKVEEVG